MSADDLAAQLALLEDILGKQVTLRDPDEVMEAAGRPDDATAGEKEPSWETWQAKPEPVITASNAWYLDPPAKRKAAAPPLPSPSKDLPPRGVEVDCSKLRLGDTVDSDVSFCPWKTLLAYPTAYIGKANKPRAQPFFDAVLEKMKWDFFYLHDPRCPEEPARLLVPTAQFERFLRDINQELKTALVIPPGVNSLKFLLKFGDGGVPKPRYLTRSDNSQSLRLAPQPTISDDDVKAFNKASTVQRYDFAASFDRMVWGASNPDKKRKALERATQRASNRREKMELVQTLLGLREAHTGSGTVFVGMDVEALEVAPHPVSEVGIAILDTNDLEGTSPGPGGSKWWDFIRAHHLRIKEHSGMTNRLHVQGCPDAFDFGESSFPANKDLIHAIMSILEPYTGAKRELIFVAHDAKQDIRYLSQIGFEVASLPGMKGDVDTRDLHQAWRGCDDGRGLYAVLSDLGIRSANLHNAGNDAVFTMRSMVGLAVEQLRKDDIKDGAKYVPALWAEPITTVGKDEPCDVELEQRKGADEAL